MGAFIGWAATFVLAGATNSIRIENILVGVFGAFIGGEFVSAMLTSGPEVPGLTAGRVAMAAGGAIVMLGLLGLMRRAVGPLRAGKARSRR